MSAMIDRVRSFGWLQWLALVALCCAYVAIVAPFLGVPWSHARRLSIMLMFPGLLVLLFAGKEARSTPATSGFAHLGAVAMFMMLAWGQPWWAVPRPQQPDDFETFVFPFLILVNARQFLTTRTDEARQTSNPEANPA